MPDGYFLRFSHALRNLWVGFGKPLWLLFSTFLTLLGIAGWQANTAIWSDWFATFGLPGDALMNPVLVGFLLGVGILGLPLFVAARWGDAIAQQIDRIVVKGRWARIYLRNFWWRVDDAIWGVRIEYYFIDQTANVRYLPRRIRLRIGHSSQISLFPFPFRVIARNHDVVLHFTLRGHRHALQFACMDHHQNEHPIPSRGWAGMSRSGWIEASYGIHLSRCQTAYPDWSLDAIRVTTEHYA